MNITMTKSTDKNINTVPRAQDPQAGVTLLLSVLIMSAVAVITITISFFVIQEIKSSRATVLTEPAIIAAESAGERGVYLLKRGASLASCTAPPLYAQVDPGSIEVIMRPCVSYGAATLELKDGEVRTLYLYDPADIHGNTSMRDAQNQSLITQIFVQHLSGGNSVVVTVQSLDKSVTLAGTPLTLVPNANAVIPVPGDIPGTSDERLLVSLTTTAGNATVVINTAGALGGGIPDYRTVDGTGCSSGANIAGCDPAAGALQPNEVFKRRINVTVPQ